ncbi:hypothetical protein [Tropicibacter sp. S64]|uniref:hypothetical protein n=1 Tax=Tropicibacter sp. S64 TaxID=3415122 RepID=UPI003C7D1F6A
MTRPFRALAVLALCALPPAVGAQTVLTGDHSVSGTLCVGGGCGDAESYPEGPLKLKANNTRILFEDNSTTSGFPANDWLLEANGESPSSGDYFAIIDQDTGNNILQLEAGAPANSLFVTDSGYVGLNTTIPRGALHLVDSSHTPEFYLEDARTGNESLWKVAANDVGFYVREVPSPDIVRIPFEIKGGAPDNAFAVSETGAVGLGIDESLAASLHILRRDGTASVLVQNTSESPAAAREMFRMENNGGSYFTLANTASGKDWFFVHENAAAGRFFINHSGGGRQMALDAAGNMTIEGELFTAGSCSAGCDRVFDADYPLPSLPEQMAAIREAGHLPNVGPTDEDGPFNLTAMTGGILNELEKAYLYIDQLQTAHDAQAATVRAQTAALAAQSSEIAALRQDLAALRDLVQARSAASDQ